MDIHPRTVIVSRARLDIMRAVYIATKEHNLSDAETIVIFADMLQSWSNYVLRAERHPLKRDRDKGVDEA